MKYGMSFGTKIFAFVTLLVVVLVAFITTKNGTFLRQMMKRQYNASLIDTTELNGSRVQNILSRWDTKLGFLVQTIAGAKDADREAIIRSFQSSENDLRGLQIYDEAGNPKSRYFGFDKGDLGLDEASLRELLNRDDITIQGHPKFPSILVLSRRVRSVDSAQGRLVLIFFDLQKILSIDSADSMLKVYLLDREMKDFGLRKKYSSIAKDKAFVKKSEKLLKSELGSGYLGELKIASDRFYVAYQNLHPYPVYLIVHQKVNVIESAIRSFFTEIIQWTVFFLLVTIILASYIVRGLLTNLKSLATATDQIARGNLDITVPVKSRDEFGALSVSFNWMTRKIAELLEHEREKVRLAQELETAQTVQNTFFKDNQLDTKILKINAFYKPASECGGDLWGHIEIRDGLELVFIGDATGHGAPAALVTALAYATVNIHSESYKRNPQYPVDPSAIVSSLNQLLFQTLQGKLCMSILLMCIDRNAGTMDYCNAGHLFPVLIPSQADDDRMGAKKVLKMLSPGKKSSGIVGISPESVFFNDRVNLRKGDRFILYTDGLTEAQNEKGRQWGTKNLQKFLEQHRIRSATELRGQLIHDVTRFNASGDQFDDDLTIVIVDYHDSEGKVA